MTKTEKDKDGDITAPCNPMYYWSPRAKSEAIKDIETGSYNYFVQIPGEGKVYIEVVKGENGKYLRTDRDKTTRNNLDELPDC